MREGGEGDQTEDASTTTGPKEAPEAPEASGKVTLPRAVLDTSALVPARLRRELQLTAQSRLFVAYWSPWIIAELNRVLTWRWIQRTPTPDLSRANERQCSEAAHTMMELLLTTFQLVETQPPYPVAWEALSDR